jgi:hypothetical protein
MIEDRKLFPKLKKNTPQSFVEHVDLCLGEGR